MLCKFLPVIIVMAPLGNCQLLSIFTGSKWKPFGGKPLIKRRDKWSMSIAESLFGNISYIYLPFGRIPPIWDFGCIQPLTLFPALPFKIERSTAMQLPLWTKWQNLILNILFIKIWHRQGFPHVCNPPFPPFLASPSTILTKCVFFSPQNRIQKFSADLQPDSPVHNRWLCSRPPSRQQGQE